MQINKILVTIDGSPYADMDLMYAIGLVKDIRSKIYVIHIQTKDYTKEALHILKAAIQLIKDSQTKDVNEILSLSDPRDIIVKTANDMKADLIILGNRCLSQITSLFLGSVSNKVVQNSTRRVLIVKKRELGS